MPSMIDIMVVLLHLAGKDKAPNCEAREADLPLAVLFDTMKMKLDEPLPQIPNTDQTTGEWLSQKTLSFTRFNAGAICKRRVGVTSI